MNKQSFAISLAFIFTYFIFVQTTMAAPTGGGGGGGTGSNNPSQLCDLLGIVAKVIRIIAPAAAIGFFLMLIYTGYKYLFSFGNPAGAADARKAMLFAIIGIVVLLLVYAIFKSLELVTGLDLLNFQVAGASC